MRGYRTTIETIEITNNLKHKVQLTTDEENLFLIVDYKNGRSMIERSFKNNYIGINQMNRTAKNFNTEDKVIKYLGLGEKT